VIPRYLRVLSVLALTILAVPSSGQPAVGLLPDLAFHFTCTSISAVSLAGDLGSFLRTSGFRSLDLAKIQAEHGLEIVHFQMEAIDSANHWITISSSPRHPDAYGLALYSTPPTHHATALEQSLIDFISVSTHCDVKNVDRHENGVEALGIFQRQVSRVEALFQEADGMARKEHR
jgi:hypothetical protein